LKTGKFNPEIEPRNKNTSPINKDLKICPVYDILSSFDFLRALLLRIWSQYFPDFARLVPEILLVVILLSK
jgi:hypothetical protein